MNNDSLLSVIIPVYNVEQYLDQCIKSVIDQTYKNIEIILIDDGSKDNSPYICDKWSKIDNRIKVIHTENGGGGRARNIGIKVAKGQWITFVDSDDYINERMYEYLFSLIEDEIDIVECEMILTNDNFASFDKIDKSKIIKCSTLEALMFHIQDTIFRQTIPNKIYRSNIIKNEYISEGKFIDDEFWTYKVIAKSKKLIHSFCKLYAYRQQNTSVMHQKYSLKRLQAIEAKENRLNFIKRNFPVLINSCKFDLARTIIYQMQKTLQYLNNKDRIEAINILNKSFRNININWEFISNCNFKDRFWLFFSKCSLINTCKLRNMLKIGL